MQRIAQMVISKITQTTIVIKVTYYEKRIDKMQSAIDKVVNTFQSME